MNLNASRYNFSNFTKPANFFAQNFSAAVLTKASMSNSSLPFFNRNFDKKRLKLLFSWYYANKGENAAFSLVETLQKLGFTHAMKAGISLGIDDLQVPPTKKKSITKAVESLNTTKNSVYSGDVMALEEFQQFVDMWHRTSEQLKTAVVQNFTKSSFNSIQKQCHGNTWDGKYKSNARQNLTYKYSIIKQKTKNSLTKLDFQISANNERFFHYFGNTLNPVYMMAFSGARGNLSQVRQLVGMRGLMADPQGQLVEFPIQSNFREGLTVTEYMISCYGARKGLVDTALRTAAAGYLTRRLVDVAHHQIVRFVTCGTKGGIWLSTQINKKIQQSQDVILPSTWQVPQPHLDKQNKQFVDKSKPLLAFNSQKLFKLQSQHNKSCSNYKIKEPGYITKHNDTGDKKQFLFAKHPTITRCIGRVLARDIPGVAFRNQEIDIALGSLPLLRRIYDTVGIYIRSPLTCKSETGVCQLCYGWSVSANRLVGLGEAVGIVAAQSIGEPGTQLTMRTFHTGGVFSGDIMEECRAKHGGIVFFQGLYLGLMVRTAGGAIAFCIKTPGTLVIKGKENLTTYQLSANSLLFVRQGETVLINSLLAQIPNLPEIEENTGESTKTIYSSFSGEIRQTPTINKALENIRILAGQQNLPIYVSHKQIDSYVSVVKTSINNKTLVESERVLKGKSRWQQNSKNLKFSNVQPINYYLNSPTSVHFKKAQVLFMYPGVHRLGQTTGKSKRFISSFQYQLKPLKHNSLLEQLQTKKTTEGPLNLINNLKYNVNRSIATKQLQIPCTPVTTLLEGDRDVMPLVYNFDSLSSEIKGLLKKRELFSYKYGYSRIMTQFLPYIRLDIKKVLNLNAKSIKFKCFNTILKTLDNSCLLSVRYKPILNPKSIIKTKFNHTHWIEPTLFNDFSGENQTIPLSTNPIKTRIVSNKLLGLNLVSVTTFFKFIELKNYAYLFWTKWSIIFFKSYTTSLFLGIVKNQKKNKVSFNSIQAMSSLSQLQITLNLRHKIFSFSSKSLKVQRGTAINIQNSKLKSELVLRAGLRLSQAHMCIYSSAQEQMLNQQGFNPKPTLAVFPLVREKKLQSLPTGFMSNYHQGRITSSAFVPLENIIKTDSRSTSSSSICCYLQKNTFYFFAQKSKGLKHHFLYCLQPQWPNVLFRTNTNDKNPFFKSGEIFPIQGYKSIQDFKKIFRSKVGTHHINGLLTKFDRISYKLPQEPVISITKYHKKQQDLCLQIGAFLNTGDELATNYGSTTCGQVIEKSFSVVTLRFTQNILYSNFKFRPATVSPNVQDGKWLPKGTPLVTLPYISSVTGDIVAGIPKIEQLFEARGEALQEIVDKIWHSYNSIIVPKSKAVRECFKEIGLFLVGAIQKVYSSQGVHIADKHLEVVIRQMTKRVLITDSGDTEFLTDEFVDINTIECVNWTTYGQMASYRPHLIGITKISLNSNSFLSSASFQQTARVLERETFLEKTDRLLGLKERVMMGALINAGTGGFRTDVFLAKVRKKSVSSDARNLYKKLNFFSRRVIEQNRANY